MSIWDFLKRRRPDHPLLDPDGSIFLFIFRDKLQLIEERESAFIIGIVMSDRDSLVRQARRSLSQTKFFCASAKIHTGVVLANWIRSGEILPIHEFCDASFLGTLRKGDFQDTNSAYKTLGFIPYIVGLGPISQRYAQVICQKLTREFPNYLGSMFFASPVPMKIIADALYAVGPFEMDL